MRAAAIFGLGRSAKDLRPFQSDKMVDWRIGMPAAPDEADGILLFGGDGTIHRHLPQLVKLGLPVLVVPAGSGNDFAHALGLQRVRDSLRAWERFCQGARNVREIDLGTITAKGQVGTRDSGLAARYFCCVAGVGLDSEVSRRANQLPRWLRGHGGYALSLLPALFCFAPFRLRLQTKEDAGEWTVRSDQPTMLAAFANAPFYGDGMKIAPRAEMNDGLLDVCAIQGIDAFKLFCMFPTVYGGQHLQIKEVEYFQTKRARIETEHPMDVYADGEFVCRTPVEIGVERAALRVITPAREP